MESSLANHRSIGVDINPLSVLISKVKTTPLEIGHLERVRARLMRSFSTGGSPIVPDFPNRELWFNPYVTRQLAKLKEAIETTDMENEYRDFFKVCFSSIVRKCSNADPRISPPVYSKQMHKLNKNGRRIFVRDYFIDTLTKNCNRLISFQESAPKRLTRVILGDCTRSNLKHNSLDLIITSPPYVDAQKYMRSFKLELFWLGLKHSEFVQIDKQSIGTENIGYSSSNEILTTGIPYVDSLLEKISLVSHERAFALSRYLNDMVYALKSTFELLTNKGTLILVVGNNKVAGERIPLDRCLRLVSETMGFYCDEILIDTIKSRGFMTKRNKTAGIIDSERVMVLRKD